MHHASCCPGNLLSNCSRLKLIKRLRSASLSQMAFSRRKRAEFCIESAAILPSMKNVEYKVHRKWGKRNEVHKLDLTDFWRSKLIQNKSTFRKKKKKKKGGGRGAGTIG